jgi:hypothetical protein
LLILYNRHEAVVPPLGKYSGISAAFAGNSYITIKSIAHQRRQCDSSLRHLLLAASEGEQR